MTVADGFLSLIALCGAFLLVSPWLDPESDVVRRAWSWLSTLLALRYLTPWGP